MIDFAAARRTMVENQIRTYDVTDQALLASFETVPREAFVDRKQVPIAYLDRDLTARDGETRLLTPMVLARLLQALMILPGERVLDVNGGGYGAALIAGLGARVVSAGRNAEATRAALAEAGVSDVEVVEASPAEGAPDKGPYDAILVHGAASGEPAQLIRQLKDGGRLAVVVGQGRSGRAMVYRRVGTAVSGKAQFDAAAPVLPDLAEKPAFRF